MRLLTFDPHHIFAVAASSRHTQGLTTEALFRMAVTYAAHPALTGVDDEDRIIACAGVIIAQPGLGTGWALMTDLVTLHPKWFHQTVIRELGLLIDIYHLRRVQVTVDESYAVGCRWIEHLGFVNEGRLRAFGTNGEAHLMYAKVNA